MITEQQWNKEAAEEAVVLMRTEHGAAALVGIVGDSGTVEVALDKNLAYAFAARILALAGELPDPPRILRRPTDIDDQLRERDV